MRAPLRRGLIAGAAALAAAGAFEAVKFHNERQERQATALRVAELNHEIGLPPEAAFHERVDRVRKFINANSLHRIDEAFYAHWGDNALIIEKMLRFSRGTGTRPHMECSSRAGLMEMALQALGFETRSVSVYGAAEGFPSHTFLEVLNPETGAWEIQDPDYDVFWLNRKTGARASIRDVLAHGADTVVPCTGAERCGWDVESWENMKIAEVRAYMGIASIVDRGRGLRPLLVNRSRASIETPFPAKGKMLDYCAYVPKNCRQDIVYLDGPALD